MKRNANNYVSRPKAGAKRHDTAPEEITEAFICAGWIGRRRQLLKVVRVPHLDIGPGPVESGQ